MEIWPLPQGHMLIFKKLTVIVVAFNIIPMQGYFQPIWFVIFKCSIYVEGAFKNGRLFRIPNCSGEAEK